MAEEISPVVGNVVEEVEVVPAAVVAQAQRGCMRWTNVMSGFVLRRMCQLISSGVRTDKGFKEVHLNQVVKDLNEFTGNEVSGVQVYNHLCKWRQRWVKVSKLRELSGAHWDEDNFMIVLEQEHFNGHVKMMTIFGSGMATGKYSMGSNEPLGCPSEFADTSLKADVFGEEITAKASDEVTKNQVEVTNTAVAIRERDCVSRLYTMEGRS